MPRYVPFTVRYARYLWQYELTPAGRFLFWSVLFTSTGTATVIMQIYQIFCVLFAAYVVVWVANAVYRPKLSCTGSLPRRITAGQTIEAEFELKNLSWRPAYDLMLWIVGLPPQCKILSADLVIPRLGPGERGKLPLLVQVQRRGIYQLPDLRPHSTFPFNLMRSGSLRVPLSPVLVVPNFHRIRDVVVPVGLRYQPGGIALSSHVGESPEYIGNREYVPGEPARRLDFRSWARLAKPVVREYQEEYYCRIALILDTHIPARRQPSDGFRQLEAAISLAASIADGLSTSEHVIDIFAAGPELYVFRAGRNVAHFDNVLEILASVDWSPRNPFESIGPAISDELTSITTTVLVLLDWDESREKLTREAVEAGCEIKLILVRDTPPTRPLPTEAMDITVLTCEQIERGGIDRL